MKTRKYAALAVKGLSLPTDNTAMQNQNTVTDYYSSQHSLYFGLA